MPLLDGMRVVHSKIHGYGVVTMRPFKKGDLLCYGDGVLYAQDTEFDDTYALVVDNDSPHHAGELLYWDLACQTRWFNHSCEPNSEVLSKWDPEADTLRAWWVAKRDIDVGEEIVYDYAFVAEVAEPCYCGAPGCRGLIVDEDPENLAKLPEHLRDKLKIPASRAAS